MKIRSLQYLALQARFGIYFIVPIFILSCSGKASSERADTSSSESKIEFGSKRSNLNLSLLIDLSDRISPVKHPNPTMDFYKRDLGYINSVCSAFLDHLQSKKIITMDDHIQTYFDPPPASGKINDLSNRLKFSFDKRNASKELLSEMKVVYPRLIDSIYKLAISDNKYVGSDTWGFFKNKLPDFCIRPEYRNILVLLTDGYMYHVNSIMKDGNKTSYLKPQDVRRQKLVSQNWHELYVKNNYGFIPAAKNLKNIDILVLGINPLPGNPYEGDVIMRYWSDWFKSMGLKESNFSIKMSELPSNLDLVISDFIKLRSQSQ